MVTSEGEEKDSEAKEANEVVLSRPWAQVV